MPKKRALLIGINKYPFLTDFAQLEGCHNDVLIFKQVLLDKFGFAEKDISVLLSEEATRSEILKEMFLLVENCEQDDNIVFFFSGHGSRAKATDRNKSSGYYETIMPFDSGRLFAHPEAVNRDITDDEIHSWLMKLGEKTSNITLIFDSCFASSIIRNEEDTRLKKGIAPTDQMPEESPRVFKKTEAKTDNQLKKGRSGWLPLSEKYVLLSAAREYEPANIYKSENSQEEFGIFTYYLCEALREAKDTDTYFDIWEQLFVRVKSHFEDQNPQLEGKRDRKLFGLEEFVPFRFLPVARRENKRVFLSGGELHGVMNNSIWAIYPSGTKDVTTDRENLLGKIKIVLSESLTSEAVVLEEVEPGAIMEGQRAVEISYPKRNTILRVWIENSISHLEPQVENLKAQLSQSHFLKIVADRNHADIRIQLRNILQNQIEESNHESATVAPVWLVYGRENHLLMPARPVGPVSNITEIIKNLECIAQYQRTLNLKNPNSVLQNKIDFLILRQNEDLTWSEIVPEDEGSELVIHEFERIALRIINRFDAPIFFSILDMGLSKKITLLYPPPGANIMIGVFNGQPSDFIETEDRKGIMTIGQNEDAYLEISFPPNFPYVLPGTSENSLVKEGLEIYKLFVTTRPHDLSFLEQESVRGDLIIREGEFENMICDVIRSADKDFGEETLSELKNEWTTVEKPFILRMKS